MKTLLVFNLLVFQSIIGFSQFSADSPFAISVSYYGDFGIHPGAKLAGYYSLNSFEKTKERKLKKRQKNKGNKIKFKTYYGIVSIGGYSHANNHNGWSGHIGVGYERLNVRTHNLFGYSLTTGYLYRDYKFDTYQLVDGEIESIRFAGSGGVVIGLSPHFGRDLTNVFKFPLKVQVKPIIQLMQYNHGFVPNAAIEFEFIFNL